MLFYAKGWQIYPVMGQRLFPALQDKLLNFAVGAALENIQMNMAEFQ